MLWVLIRIASPQKHMLWVLIWIALILMRTHNICFYGGLTKIILQLSSNTLLICSTVYDMSTKYCKFPKYSDTQKICCNHPQSWTRWRLLRVMHPKDAEGIANSVGAVWSGSALFAKTCLSENLGNYGIHQEALQLFFFENLFINLDF